MSEAPDNLVLVYLRKTPVESTRLHIALGLVGGGAIGNLIDRMLYGKVTDFIVWKVGVHEWPAYNVADAAIEGVRRASSGQVAID